MTGRNSIVKNPENMSKHNAKSLPENSLSLPRNAKTTKWYHPVMTSMTMFSPNAKL